MDDKRYSERGDGCRQEIQLGMGQGLQGNIWSSKRKVLKQTETGLKRDYILNLSYNGSL